jgi:hypothetical protein
MPIQYAGCYSGAAFFCNQEEVVKKAMLLAMSGVLLLAGCESKKQASIPVEPKWKGPAYRLAFDTKPPKPNPSGVTIPGIKWTANPDALETRAVLVVRYDSSGVKSDKLIVDQVILGATDIKGPEGQLTDDYIALADQGIAHLLGVYKVKGKVKVQALLVRSSISPSAGPDELTNKALSDWISTDIDFKGGKAK